jgi:ribosome-binding protein aMBF1 (putative translation factor)
VQRPPRGSKRVMAMNKAIETDKTFPAWLTMSWAWEQTLDDPAAVRAALARNLRRLREAHGLTQKLLAERAKTNLATVKDIESAKALPDIALIADLAGALDLPCPTLLIATPD